MFENGNPGRRFELNIVEQDGPNLPEQVEFVSSTKLSSKR
jgi:hypothetical protein